jgi:hypothetical protein
MAARQSGTMTTPAPVGATQLPKLTQAISDALEKGGGVHPNITGPEARDIVRASYNSDGYIPASNRKVLEKLLWNGQLPEGIDSKFYPPAGEAFIGPGAALVLQAAITESKLQDW